MKLTETEINLLALIAMEDTEKLLRNQGNPPYNNPDDPLGLEEFDTFSADFSPDGAVGVTYPDYWVYRDEHHYKQKRPETDYSCPRCYSKNIKVKYPVIKCGRCKYSEELFDFPISEAYKKALERESVAYSPNREIKQKQSHEWARLLHGQIVTIPWYDHRQNLWVRKSGIAVYDGRGTYGSVKVYLSVDKPTIWGGFFDEINGHKVYYDKKGRPNADQIEIVPVTDAVTSILLGDPVLSVLVGHVLC